MIRGQAGPGESEEPSYTFWKQGIPVHTEDVGSSPTIATRLPFSSVGRARNYTFVVGYVMLLITVGDESYFSLLSSGSWVRVPQWQQKYISAHCTMVAVSPMRNIS